MADQPDLPASTGRRRLLQWKTLLEEHGLTGDHFPSISALVTAAKKWFTYLLAEGEGECWRRWLFSGDGYEVYGGVLEELKRQVHADFAQIWKGHLGYEKLYRPRVETALAKLVEEETKRALGVESKRLENAAEIQRLAKLVAISPRPQDHLLLEMMHLVPPSAEPGQQSQATNSAPAVAEGASPEPAAEPRPEAPAPPLEEERLAASAPASVGRQAEAASRCAAIDAFLLKCNAFIPKFKQDPPLKITRIYRTHIWRAVGHGRARQFEFWQAADPKATTSDDKNFPRILAMDPAAFIALLKEKGII